MPWSEWIEPDVTTAGSNLAGRYIARGGSGGVSGWAGIDGLVDSILVSLRSGVGSIEMGGGDSAAGGYSSSATPVPQSDKTTGFSASLFQSVFVGGLGLDPEVERDYFPALLSSLELGVDFDVRPDRTDADEDAYVEYEPGSNTLIGWQDFDLTIDPIDSTYANSLADEAVPVEAHYRIAIDATPLWGAGPFDAPDSYTEDVPWVLWEDAETVATFSFTGNNEGNTIPVHIEDAPLTVSDYRFTMVMQSELADPSYLTVLDVDEPVIPSLEENARQDSGALIVGVDIEGGVVVSGPAYLFQMPRWRYWIPGRLPLRQRQRDDGLALGPLRQRGRTSRQGTNRQRAYD